MNLHLPYHIKLRRTHDFEVEYRFLTAKEGGRKTGLPFQGYRCNFYYETHQTKQNNSYTIWPEFLYNNKDLFMQTDKPVLIAGKARIWIMSEEMREFHRQNIKVGLSAYFMEGKKKIAECTVISISGL